MKNKQHGQSLMEVLVATGVGTILITAAVAIIAPTLKTSKTVSNTQTAVGLGKELLESVEILGDSDWHNITNLATTSLYVYYAHTTSSPFAIETGIESIPVATTTFARYFYIEDVNRDGGNNIIASGGAQDPSTKKVVVVYGWQGGPTSTISSYITRSRNKIFMQTNWSGGDGVDGPVTSTESTFASSLNINVATTTGSIVIDL